MSQDVDVAKLLDSLGIRGRKSGDEWKTLCPNPEHDDRRIGSFMIADAPGEQRNSLFRCYSCGVTGNAVQLVRLKLGVGYHAAVSWIDEYARPDEAVAPRLVMAQPRSTVFRYPAGVEELPLPRWPTLFRRHLEERGVEPAQVERWHLAFSVEGKLAGRVVIPTRAQSGRLLNWAARAIGQDRSRYLTPAKDEGPDASAVFGEEHWRPGGIVVCVEGAFKALGVERACPHALAVLGSGGGTHRNPAAIAKLERFERVIVVADGNDAGDQHASDVADAVGPRAVVVRMPDEKGPDDVPVGYLRAAIASALRS